MKYEKKIDTIIVFIYNKKYLDDKIDNIIDIVFKNLKYYYDIEFKESYDIKLYLNKYYGIILEIKENDNSFKSINILKDVLFLYEVEDPLDYLDNEIYYYEDKFYINLKEDNIKIFENSDIIYGKDVYKIIGKGIKLWYN